MKKKKRSTFLVLLCIIFLLLIIVLPPLCRSMFPKKTYSFSKKIMILKCERTDDSDVITATMSAKYINSKLISNTIKFNGFSSVVGDEKAVVKGSLRDEMENFKKVKNLSGSELKGVITYVVDKGVIANNSDNSFISNYYQSIDKLKTYYEYNQYTCNIIE